MKGFLGGNSYEGDVLRALFKAKMQKISANDFLTIGSKTVKLKLNTPLLELAQWDEIDYELLLSPETSKMVKGVFFIALVTEWLSIDYPKSDPFTLKYSQALVGCMRIFIGYADLTDFTPVATIFALVEYLQDGREGKIKFTEEMKNNIKGLIEKLNWVTNGLENGAIKQWCIIMDLKEIKATVEEFTAFNKPIKTIKAYQKLCKLVPQSLQFLHNDGKDVKFLKNMYPNSDIVIDEKIAQKSESIQHLHKYTPDYTNTIKYLLQVMQHETINTPIRQQQLFSTVLKLMIKALLPEQRESINETLNSTAKQIFSEACDSKELTAKTGDEMVNEHLRFML